ncbi:hypothetical protein MWH28_10565 [Natroniella sulfidigena]|uniref:hypothetical protein n=1 Tax=Natroniella sulfidigena TaxID=723921 RepID=UPI00200AC9E3|nr:hypothetical protein [Natroniella sulfidigena]MCK8817804.1 hypothetical protein [Natroniella sulfidigena]
MSVVGKYRELKISDCDIKNLFLTLGCLVIRNYSKMILKYDDRLTAEIKKSLILVLNNLQICSQLQSRIFALRERINEMNLKLNELAEFQTDLKKELEGQQERFNKSLNKKEEKLAQLNKENINSLLKIGKLFYQHKLLNEKEEFVQLYNKLDFLLDEEDKVVEGGELLGENLDKKQAELYNLLQPYPSFLA